MPKCHLGDHSVPAEELRRVGGALACSACRKLKGIEGDIPMAEVKKSVIFVNVSEIEKSTDGHTIVKDHKIEAQIGLGGLSLKWDVTFDQIRDFFTKRREGATSKKKNPLTAV
jgi:hypothetical protein